MNSTKTALWHDFHQTGAEVRCLYNSWRTSHVTKTWALLLYEPLVCHDSSVALVCPLIMMNLWNFSWGNTWTTDIINQFSRAPNSKLRVLKPERGIQRREVAGKHGKITSPSCVTGRQSLQARTLDAAGHTLNFCKGSCHSSWQRAFNMVGWGQGVCEGIQGVWRNVTEFDDVFLVAEIWSFIMIDMWYLIMIPFCTLLLAPFCISLSQLQRQKPEPGRHKTMAWNSDTKQNRWLDHVSVPGPL